LEAALDARWTTALRKDLRRREAEGWGGGRWEQQQQEDLLPAVGLGAWPSGNRGRMGRLAGGEGEVGVRLEEGAVGWKLSWNLPTLESRERETPSPRETAARKLRNSSSTVVRSGAAEPSWPGQGGSESRGSRV
jgi:hypothetical protein